MYSCSKSAAWLESLDYSHGRLAIDLSGNDCHWAVPLTVIGNGSLLFLVSLLPIDVSEDLEQWQLASMGQPCQTRTLLYSGSREAPNAVVNVVWQLQISCSS